jgi:hypothetical protein
MNKHTPVAGTSRDPHKGEAEPKDDARTVDKSGQKDDILPIPQKDKGMVDYGKDDKDFREKKKE